MGHPVDKVLLAIACDKLGYDPANVDDSSNVGFRPDDGVDEFIVTIITHRTNVDEINQWADDHMPSTNEQPPPLYYDHFVDVVRILIVDDIYAELMYHGSNPIGYDPRFEPTVMDDKWLDEFITATTGIPPLSSSE